MVLFTGNPRLLITQRLGVKSFTDDECSPRSSEDTIFIETIKFRHVRRAHLNAQSRVYRYLIGLYPKNQNNPTQLIVQRDSAATELLTI